MIRAAILFLMLSGPLPLPRALAELTDVAPPPAVAVFPIEVADTSGEPPNPQWPAQVAVVTAELGRELAASGRYRLVDLAPVQDRMAGLDPLYACGGCWRDVARAAGADTVAIAAVHKMSTLIASLHLWLLDVETQRIVWQGAVSLRGDTEEAWRRAASFLLRRGVLGDDPGRPMLSSPFPGG